MKTDLIEELKWRGMLANSTPEIGDVLKQEKIAAYIGFDPTGSSLHVGSLMPIMLLKHLQNHGHKPLVLVGGATGMIGDPSGKSKERVMIDEATISYNVSELKKQLSYFLDFNDTSNGAEILNNYDWTQPLSVIDFVRDAGKHLTVNYMMAKESVKKRIGQEEQEGMSFTEFTYQLFQAYDFFHLYRTKNCKLQLGGTDQWGNITSGIELIRKKTGGTAHAITIPLITKSDGSKFGKTEEGTIWLNKKLTSVYKFYQFWINTSDEEAEKFIKYFTFLDEPTITKLIEEHKAAPHERLLQKTLAEEVCCFIHSMEDFKKAVYSSNILFGKSTTDDLKKIDKDTLLEIFEGVPQIKLSKNLLTQGLPIIEALSVEGFLPSKAEARRALKSQSIYVNKQKVDETKVLYEADVIAEGYIILQKGKKQFYLLEF